MVHGKPAALADRMKQKALDIAIKGAILTELLQGAKKRELVKKYSTSQSTTSTILKKEGREVERAEVVRRHVGSEHFDNKWANDAGQSKRLRIPVGFSSSRCAHGIVFKSTLSETASASDQDAATWLETNRDAISSYAE
ncbi:hypothetical protein HPB50_001259 [Hyalomma asiaticum]|uniref:Uncharacterized protein n=1 Tax=Hyalomma asiaticum TaxID=266040 RepID=A0ACB7RKP6_HYAAI|nr:hypothetical protein HPB50_001259 [Hyalomma asiaticum]